MNQECRFVESRQTNAIRRLAISLPVAKRQGYHSEAIRKEKACFQGGTVTALRGRASIVAKTRPRKAVTVAPHSIPA